MFTTRVTAACPLLSKLNLEDVCFLNLIYVTSLRSALADRVMCTMFDLVCKFMSGFSHHADFLIAVFPQAEYPLDPKKFLSILEAAKL